MMEVVEQKDGRFLWSWVCSVAATVTAVVLSLAVGFREGVSTQEELCIHEKWMDVLRIYGLLN